MTATTTIEGQVSIGRILKSHRERNNISIADIASKMHLDSRIIHAIEDDKYHTLPDPIYVRGYIRSYSKLVNADADALVKLYEQHGGDFEPEIIPEIKHPTQSSSSDRPVKAFTWLIILVLAIMLFAWSQSKFVIETSTLTRAPDEPADQLPTEPAGSQSYTQSQFMPEYSQAVPSEYTSEYAPEYSTDNYQQVSPDPFTGAINNGSLPDSDLQTGASLPASIGSDLPGALPPSGPGTNDPMLGSGLSDITVADLELQPSVSAANPLTIDGQAVSTRPETHQPSASNDPSMGMTRLPEPGATVSSLPAVHQTIGPDLIVLKLTADSWIEIVDANNTKVFFDLGRPGDTFNVRGTAPFDVLLGFAQAVSLEFNGSPFDVAPHSRAGVARFTLGD